MTIFCRRPGAAGCPAILYCWFFLYLAFAGGGEWSLDNKIARSRAAAT